MKPAIATLLLLLAGACGGTPATPKAVPPTPGPATVKISGQFQIYANDWFKAIANSTWDPCNGTTPGDSCSGAECVGTAAADGLGYGTEVLVTDAAGTKIGLGEVTSTWTHSPSDGANNFCRLYWSVDVLDQPGVMTATFAGDTDWSIDFTVEQMKTHPHKLDFMGIGDD